MCLKMNGLLIDYEYCYGCQTCIAACMTEHGYGPGFSGIELHQIGPKELAPDEWEYTFVPVPTDLCDLCAERVSEGRLPTCVHHCNAKVMEYGPIGELAVKAAEKPHVAIYSIKE